MVPVLGFPDRNPHMPRAISGASPEVYDLAVRGGFDHVGEAKTDAHENQAINLLTARDRARMVKRHFLEAMVMVQSFIRSLPGERERTYVHASMDSELLEHLHRMVETGLFGGNVDEVMSFLIASGVQAAVKGGLYKIADRGLQGTLAIVPDPSSSVVGPACNHGAQANDWGDTCHSCGKTIPMPF